MSNKFQLRTECSKVVCATIHCLLLRQRVRVCVLRQEVSLGIHGNLTSGWLQVSVHLGDCFLKHYKLVIISAYILASTPHQLHQKSQFHQWNQSPPSTRNYKKNDLLVLHIRKKFLKKKRWIPGHLYSQHHLHLFVDGTRTATDKFQENMVSGRYE